MIIARHETFPWYQGAHWDYEMTVKDDDTKQIIDLTDFTALCEIRRTIEDPEAVISLSLGAGITIDGPAGKLRLLVDNLTTRGIDVDSSGESWVGDCLVTDAAGLVSKVLTIDIPAERAITRPWE